MSPVDYHGWTHLPKEMGGTDPIDLSFLAAGGSNAVFANAQRLSSFNHTGSTSFAWTDIHANDNTAFDVGTTNVTNDTVVLDDWTGDGSALLVVVSAAGKTTPSNDWGIGTTISQMNPANGGAFGFSGGQGTSGGALGAIAIEIRMGIVFLPSEIVTTLVHSGTMNFAFAAQNIAMFPVSTGSDWLNIL